LAENDPLLSGIIGSPYTVLVEQGKCLTVPTELGRPKSIKAPPGKYILYSDANCNDDPLTYPGGSCLNLKQTIGSILLIN